ncbi:ACT domain-containing protein [Lactobacillus sp.]|uniref:ACT domain-containing protein n=1 Tax=Lactobacillus sp. TaxID=1591 RepID=UPI003EF38E70
MRAILTTVGQDKTGIVAGVSGFLAEKEINILDLSQTILNGYFTMMMVVDVPDDADFTALSNELTDLGKKLGVEINIRNEKMYAAMHELSGGLE